MRPISGGPHASMADILGVVIGRGGSLATGHVHDGHADVEQTDVGAQRRGEFDGLSTVLGDWRIAVYATGNSGRAGISPLLSLGVLG